MAVRRNSLVMIAATVVAVASIGYMGCDDEYDYTPATEDGSGYDGTAPVPGPSAAGWVSDYGAERATCGCPQADLAERPHVTVGETTIYVGYEQVTGTNQDPVVARYDNGQLVWCKYHETQGPDGRAVGITWDGGEYAYVVFTIVGGGTDLEGNGGWISSYAPHYLRASGSKKVSCIGRVNVTNGELETSTFVIAVMSENRINSHGPSGAVTVLTDGNVEFLGGSAHKPVDSDGLSSMECTEYPFHSRYRFSPDLTSLVCCECTNCVSDQPCQ